MIHNWARTINAHIIVALIVILFDMSVASAAPTAANSSIPLLIGVNTSVYDGPQTVQMAHDLGANAVRIDAGWNDVERVKGHFQIPAWLDQRVNEARALHMTPILILEYGNRLYGGGKPLTPAYRGAFARYAKVLVTHFRERVRLFELWNEWEGTTGGGAPGSPEDYVALARVVYPAIKHVDPQAILLSGGMFTLNGKYVDWFKKFLAIGGLKYVDALSFHPYNFQLGSRATPGEAIARLQEMHDLAVRANGGRPIDVYVSEMGYPDYSGAGGQHRDTVAAFIQRFMLLAAAHPYIRGVIWYCLRDQGRDRSNREASFGLYSFDYKPKPQGVAFSQVAQFLRSVRTVSAVKTSDRTTIDVTCDSERHVKFQIPVRPSIAPQLPNCAK